MEIIINTNMVWDTPPTARHQLTEAFVKKGIKVSFITGNKLGAPGLDILPVNDYLSVVTPTFPFSRRFRYRLPFINELYQHWLYPQLKRMYDKEDAYIISGDFGGYLMGKYFDNLIYFASDDYINNVPAPFLIKKYTEYTQKKLIKSAKFTLATARNLVSYFSGFNDKSFELPLGAPEFGLNPDLEDLYRTRDGKIKVVLLGFIDKVKTPVSLLNRILDLGNTELYLIGPIKDDILDHLNARDRVYPLGIQTNDTLAKTLMTMDVGIAPYRMDDANTGRTPNKMWQYLAVGKPAVITNLPNVRHWQFPQGTVYKANSDEEFARMIGQAYREDSRTLIAERIRLATDNSWVRRADLILEYINKTLDHPTVK